MEINWAEKLEDLGSRGANTPEGDGWFSAKDFIENMGVGRNRGYRLLQEAIIDGKMEVFNGSEYNPVLGQKVRRIWYRFISKD